MTLSLAVIHCPKINNIFLYLIVLLLLYPFAVSAAEKEAFIGVLAKRGVEHTLHKWQPTADYLSREIPGYHFTIKPLDFDAITPAVASGAVDFILTNPSFYVGLEAIYGVNRIATLKNRVGASI
ncbi:MAG: phosphate/phosphite/phosphonate ABC transporter substrate-binding protein, partial [Gammaproteobacteria bacterium]|nr:phosphate/phosphite/phosphonate ABC transporter substrate-binding protein [Gammaproteobacteria bacterium]